MRRNVEHLAWCQIKRTRFDTLCTKRGSEAVLRKITLLSRFSEKTRLCIGFIYGWADRKRNDLMSRSSHVF